MSVALARVIDRHGRIVQLRRVTDGGFSKEEATYGQPLPNTAKPAPIKAVIQPAGARDAKYLASLPEGLQTETRLVCYTRARLAENDQVLDGADLYRVLEVEDRSHDGNYWVGYLGSVKP